MQSNREAIDHYAANNPVRYTDPDGRVFNVIAAAIGAVIGATIGAATTALAGGSRKDIAAAALGGAASGALGGFSFGTSLIAQAATATVVGAAGGAIGDVVTKAVADDEITASGVAKAAVGGAIGGLVGFGAGKAVDYALTPKVRINSSKYPESAQHIIDAQKNGQPKVLTIDRKGANARRTESLKGLDKVPGKQLDEYPPAMFKEGGFEADIRAITPKDNMGSGASMGNQLRNIPDGTRVMIIVE